MVSNPGETGGEHVRKMVVERKHIVNAVQIQEQEPVGETVEDTWKRGRSALPDSGCEDGLGPPKNATIGSVNMIRKVMVVTKRISFNTFTFGGVTTTSASCAASSFFAARAMTILGRVSGMNDMTTTKKPAKIKLIQYVNRGVLPLHFLSLGFGSSLDPKDPIQAHVGIKPDPFTNWASDTGTGVRGHDEQGHGLCSMVGVSEKVRDGTGNVRQGRTACNTAQKHEDNHHGEIESKSAALQASKFSRRVSQKEPQHDSLKRHLRSGRVHR